MNGESHSVQLFRPLARHIQSTFVIDQNILLAINLGTLRSNHNLQDIQTVLSRPHSNV